MTPYFEQVNVEDEMPYEVDIYFATNKQTGKQPSLFEGGQFHYWNMVTHQWTETKNFESWLRPISLSEIKKKLGVIEENVYDERWKAIADEGYPKSGFDLLVSTLENGMRFNHVAQWHGGNDGFLNSYEKLHFVTHWKYINAPK